MIDRLQRAYNLMCNTNMGVIINILSTGEVETLDDLSAESWLKIYDAYKASGWDFTPCRWEQRQILDALCGIVPRWDENEKPIY